MAVFLQPIYTQTVGAGGAASITFNNIPQTFTDLKLLVSSRNSYSGVGDDINVTFNGVSTNRSSRFLYGTGASAASTTGTTLSALTTSNTATSNTFANVEFYIPNYTGSNFKSFIGDSVTENNATTAYTALHANLWSSTNAITSITIAPASGNWLQYSTFSLYGILRQGV